MSWKEYYNKTKDLPPRPLLKNILKSINKESYISMKAIDLGCGAGQDSRELLRLGFEVTSIDSEDNAIEELRLSHDSKKLTCINSKFENIKELPKSSLIYASLSLPFCEEKSFEDFWTIIKNSLLDEGWLAFSFFGPEDDWVKQGHVNGKDKNQIEDMLKEFSSIEINEIKKNGQTMAGDEKFFHLYEVMAQKKGGI